MNCFFTFLVPLGRIQKAFGEISGYRITWVCGALFAAVIMAIPSPAVADIYVTVYANGTNGGSGGKVEIKQCPNWAPDPDAFANAPRLTQNTSLIGSQSPDQPARFYFSQVSKPEGGSQRVQISISGHVEIHCHYIFNAIVVRDFSGGPVSLTVFAGKPYELPVGVSFPPSLSQYLKNHSMEAYLSPPAGSGEIHGGNLKFITDDCKDTRVRVDAHGGNTTSGQRGGNGGEFLCQTPLNLQLSFYANGGRGGNGSTSTPDGGAGGQGGKAAILAGGGSNASISVEVNGGNGGTPANQDAIPGTGGDGGEVTVTDMRRGNASGVIHARGGMGGDRYHPIGFTIYKSLGGDGGQGGIVYLNLKPSEDAKFQFYDSNPYAAGIDVSGGNATDGELVGGEGGNGGQIQIDSPWPLQFWAYQLRANGGYGGNGGTPYDDSEPYTIASSGGTGGVGGNGGVIFTNAALFSSQSIQIDASGGDGGYGGGGQSSPAAYFDVAGTGGDGGNGGRKGILNGLDFGRPGIPGDGGGGGLWGAVGGNGGRGGNSTSSEQSPGQGGFPGRNGFGTTDGAAWGQNGGFITVEPPIVRGLPSPDFNDVRCQTLPIILIPGIAGSELKSEGTQLWPSLWPSFFEEDAVRRLSTIPPYQAPNIIATDILRHGVDSDWWPWACVSIYNDLVEYFAEMGYKEFALEEDPSRITSNYMLQAGRFRHKPDLFIFPYDWRKSNRDSAELLADYVANISLLHNAGKVRIVAHSMGGLVLRQLMVSKPDLVRNKVESAVTIGSPLLGAPTAIFRILHGDFYGNAVDWWKNDAITYALPTFAGASELLPSPAYFTLNSSVGLEVPVFCENGWDINSNRRATDSLQIGEISSLFQKHLQGKFGSAYADAVSPYSVNAQLHSDTFDNWSSDLTGVRLLHIVGIQDEQKTIVGVAAVSNCDPGHSQTMQTCFQGYETVLGKGDGTVPVLSAARTPAYLAPRAMVRYLQGDQYEHSAMVGRPPVLEWVSHFLGIGANSDTYEKFPSQAGTGTPMLISQISFQVFGRSYVRVSKNSSSNTQVGNQVYHIPGTDISYHQGQRMTSNLGEAGSIPSVVINTALDGEVLVEGDIRWPHINAMLNSRLLSEPPGGFPECATPAEGIAFFPYIVSTVPPGVSLQEMYERTKFDGRVSVFVERRVGAGNALEKHKYTFAMPKMRIGLSGTSTYHWKLLASPGPSPIGWIDWNDNRLMESSEIVQPEITAVSSSALNLAPPQLELRLTAATNGLGVHLVGQDSPGELVRIFLSTDGGRFVEYHDDGSLALLVGQAKLVRAFAVDALGNTSRMVEFSLKPQLSVSINAVGPSSHRVTWPISELPFFLETGASPSGPWSPYVGPLQETNGSYAAMIAVGNERARFFRLRLGTLEPQLSLAISAVGSNSFRVTWPTPTFPVILETATDLGATWLPYVGSIQNTNGSQSAMISVGNERSRFFRLRRGP